MLTVSDEAGTVAWWPPGTGDHGERMTGRMRPCRSDQSGWFQVWVRVGSGSAARKNRSNPPWVRVVRVGPGRSPTLSIPPYARITRDMRDVRDAEGD